MSSNIKSGSQMLDHCDCYSDNMETNYIKVSDIPSGNKLIKTI